MMTALECPTSKDLKALTLGRLSNEDSDALFQHIAECALCRSELETVEDAEDSLIASLRSPDQDALFSGESDCQVAVAKALGALATAGQSVGQMGTTGDLQQLPSSIGEYEIVRPIGRGGMGSVYLARHTKLGREVALKILATHRLADARMRERFEAEMLAVGRLSHRNIVTAHDAREVNGTAVLVTEFVSGMDLGQLLQRTGTLSVANACEIVRQIAVALSYTHQQGFVHRDIKPSNVMLSASGEVKLLDLGLARLQYGEHAGAELTGTGQAMGTADYVAPEQVTDSKTVDIRADIYALGCTLFKLLTGHAPFADEQHTTAFAKMTAHVSKTPPSLSDLLPEAPRGLVSLVDSMLAKDPRQRPQTPGHVVDALAVFCKGHELVALSATAAQLEPKPVVNSTTRSTARAATQSWMRRKVPLAAAIAAGFIGLLLGICLSIIIVITNPDGTKSILELAEGSRVEIQDKVVSENSGLASESEEVIERGKHLLMISVKKVLPQPVPISLHEDGTVSLPLLEPLKVEGLTAKEARERIEHAYRKLGILRANDSVEALVILVAHGSFSRAPISMMGNVGADGSFGEISPYSLSPLSFAILVNSESTGRAPYIDDVALAAATRLFHASSGETPVQTEHGTWVELSDDQSVPIKAQNAGKTFALVSNDMTINWSDITGHVRELQVSPGYAADPLGMIFDRELGAKFQQLTGLNIRNQMAIMVNGKIRATPHINAEIGERVSISGTFKPGEIQGLERCLAIGHLSLQTQSMQKPRTDFLAPEHTGALNLKRIGLAFHNFHDAYRKFPGSVNVREGGLSPGQRKKIYPFSWRVAILPFIEQNELFQTYRFDEPWDSEQNLKLLDKMPEVYRSPFAGDDQPLGHTNFLGFAGEHTALGTNGGYSFKDFTDGTSNTLLLFESKATVPWTKPEDIQGDVSQALFFEEQPLHYLLADGSVQSMEKIELDKLKKLITRDGGEVVEP